MVQLDGKGSTQRDYRPCVISGNEKGNKYSPNVVICPMTTSMKKLDMPTHYLVKADSENGLHYDSLVLCENPMTISKSQLGKKVGRLSGKHLEDFSSISQVAYGSIAYLSLDALIECWNKCRELVG